MVKKIYCLTEIDLEERPYATTKIYTNWLKVMEYLEYYLRENLYLYDPEESICNRELQGLTDNEKFNLIKKKSIPTKIPKENIYDIFEKYSPSLPKYLNLKIDWI